MTLNDQLKRSYAILIEAMDTYKPKRIVSLVSGGNDSLTAYYVARHFQIWLDYIVHVHTGTGVIETRQFVESWAESTDVPLLMCEAGSAYEDYVLRKGFFGRGVSAHAMSYHVLKAGPLRKGMSSLRQRRKNFPILMLTGIRLDESENRKYNFGNQTFKRDPAAKNNIFANIIEHWSQADCQEFLAQVGAPRNPVARALHRSAECMCGTMQSNEDRVIASAIYPQWGAWLDRLEAKVVAKHGWGWSENMPKSTKERKAGQLPFLIDGFEMCRHCLQNEVVNETPAP